MPGPRLINLGITTAAAWDDSDMMDKPGRTPLRPAGLPGDHQKAAAPVGIGQRDEEAAILCRQCIEPDRR